MTVSRTYTQIPQIEDDCPGLTLKNPTGVTACQLAMILDVDKMKVM